MSFSINNFLIPGQPEENLRCLADFQASDVGGTRCTTEEVHAKTPKRSLSRSTLREISLLATALAIVSGPFLLTAKKTYNCLSELFNGNLTGAQSCRDDLFATFSSPVNRMSYLCFASLAALSGVGAYAGARAYFQDKTQQERFDRLNQEYSAIAQFLLDQYRKSPRKQQKELAEMAEKLYRRKELIQMSLRETARLSEPQASLLSAKISHAALEILSIEKRSETKKRHSVSKSAAPVSVPPRPSQIEKMEG
jgi:hypothetical protein